MLLRLEKADDGKHKWVAVFSNGKRTKFGAVGYEDYTIHKSRLRRALYRKRHINDLNTRDPYAPGYLSFYILWGDSTDIEKNVREYNRRFF